jgi:hypothetical protein
MLVDLLNFVSDLFTSGTGVISFVIASVTVALSITVKQKGKKTSGLRLFKKWLKSLLSKHLKS